MSTTPRPSALVEQLLIQTLGECPALAGVGEREQLLAATWLAGHRSAVLDMLKETALRVEGARSFATAIANATFAARLELVWGTGTGAVASDSTHFGAFDQNLFTQHHVRYGGRGVLIYWHVDKKSVAINSQLMSCTASEVSAMVEGAMHHRTEMDVEANYVDSHGQSEIGFGITRFLGFELKPRLKRINVTKLYVPDGELRGRIPDLMPLLSRRGPIRWDLIQQQYDQLVKYAIAINNRTASTEAILRRFTRARGHARRVQAEYEQPFDSRRSNASALNGCWPMTRRRFSWR